MWYKRDNRTPEPSKALALCGISPGNRILDTVKQLSSLKAWCAALLFFFFFSLSFEHLGTASSQLSLCPCIYMVQDKGSGGMRGKPAAWAQPLQ